MKRAVAVPVLAFAIAEKAAIARHAAGGEQQQRAYRQKHPFITHVILSFEVEYNMLYAGTIIL